MGGMGGLCLANVSLDSVGFESGGQRGGGVVVDEKQNTGSDCEGVNERKA